MCRKIITVLCYSFLIAVGNAILGNEFTSSYRTFCETIFQSTCPFLMENEYNNECQLTSIGNTLEFFCNTENFREIPAIKGSCNLDKETEDIINCRTKLQCNITEEEYQKNVFNNCRKTDVHNIEVLAYPKYFTKTEYLNFLSSNFPNLNQILWNRCNECLPLNQFFQKLRKLKKLNMYLCANLTVCQEKTNLTQIEELRMKFNPFEVQNGKYISLINKNLLTGMENLKYFELACPIKESELEIPEELFRGFKNLSSIKFTNCSITNLTQELFQDLVNLRTLTIKGGMIKDFNWLSSPIIKNNLTILELDKQVKIKKTNMSAFICRGGLFCEFNVDIHKKPCPKGCNCKLILSPYSTVSTFTIRCDFAKYTEIPELPISTIGKTLLTITDNNLTHLPSTTLYGYSNINNLILDNNLLTRLTVDQLPPNLIYLSLRNNRLQSLDKSVLEFFSRSAGKVKLTLSENPWTCNCEVLDMIQFVANSSDKYIFDIQDLKCHGENNGISMLLYKAVDCKSYIIYKIFGPLLGLALMIIICLYYKIPIFMWLYERNYCLNWISRPEPEADSVLKIDAFLAFSHKDLELIEEYVEKLEEGPRQYQLCFYQRDWLIGESIPNCILTSIEYSKRIIILMTNNFINSSWGLFEFRSAIKATSMDKDKRLIVILYPEADIDQLDSELKRYMKYNTYLRRDDPIFWRKLMFAMPHKQVHSEQIELTEESRL